MAQNNWEADKMSVILNFTISLLFIKAFGFCTEQLCLFSSLYNWFYCSSIFLFFLLFLLWDCRLDVYIYDYLLKRNLQTTAKAFMAEGKVAADPVGKCIFYFYRFFIFIFI